MQLQRRTQYPVMENDEIRKIERSLLRVLCQPALDNDPKEASRKFHEEALNRLRSYSFLSVPHQVLFDCLWQLSRHRPELIRDLLLTCLVQEGFPDFDLAPFLEPHVLTASEAGRLLEKLSGK